MFIPSKFTYYKDEYIKNSKPKCSYCNNIAIGNFYDRDSDGFGGSNVNIVKMCHKCLENNNKHYEKIFGK